MPVHDGSRSDQDESLSPPGPERSQRNPEQLVQGSQSSARPLRVQSGQLPTESQAFKDEVLAGAKRADDPPEEMPERHNHGKNNIGTIRIQLCAKSHILQVYDLLARHSPLIAPEDFYLVEKKEVLVGAVGIESTNCMEIKEFCGAPWPSKVLKATERNR